MLSFYCATPGFLLSQLCGSARLEGFQLLAYQAICHKRREQIGKDISFSTDSLLKIPLTAYSVANISLQTHLIVEEHRSASHFMGLHNLLNLSYPRTIES